MRAIGFLLSLIFASLLAAPTLAAADRVARSGAETSSVEQLNRPTFNLQIAHNLFLAQDPTVESTLEGVEEDSSADDEGLSDEDLDLDDFLDEGDDLGIHDPLEPINRPIFAANLFLDRWILRPVTRIYIETVPEPGREGVNNFINNIESPVTLANDLLQGEMSRAGATFGRIFINTLLGFGGLIDVASAMGLPGHKEDFGQTLGSYGVGGNPYVVLPIFGPSNPRDMTGLVVDTGLDPLTYVTPNDLRPVRTGVGIVNTRARIINETDVLEATALDYYAAVRSLYYQNRAFEIRNDRDAAAGVTAKEAVPDIYGDLEEADEDEPEAGPAGR